MAKRKPKINLDKNGNPVDFVSMYFMRQHFIEKELAVAAKSSSTVVYLGRLVILENILCYKLAYYIRAIQNEINSKISFARKFIRIEDPIDLLGSTATLGSLVFEIEKLRPKSILLISLKKILADRNELTHYMHLGFSNVKDVQMRARDLTLRINRMLDRVGKETKSITPPFKVPRIPRVINISKLIQYEKERNSAKYPDYDKPAENLKKFNNKP